MGYRFIIGFIVIAVATVTLSGQKQLVISPTIDFSYSIIGENGYNGLAVVYNADKNIYYAVFAGNRDFPLEVFDSGGKSLYTTKTMVDMRGLWYNAKEKQLEGTMYTSGFYVMHLDENGYPTNAVLPSNSGDFVPPDMQSQTVFNPAKNEIYAYNNGMIYVYGRSNFKQKKKIPLKNNPVSVHELNPVGIIFTGYKKYEFGLYDAGHAKLHFFDASGNYTGSAQLPNTTASADWFRICYTNDRFFIYDVDQRIWYAHRLFMNPDGTD